MASTATTTTMYSKSTKIANPVTHSALDFFERPHVLIKHKSAYDQEIFPHVACRGPQLDFFVTAENKNCIDLNRICLALDVSLYTPDGKTLVKPGTDPVFIYGNNLLHSLISHAELFLNGKLISSSNNNHHHAAFVETELTSDTECKQTWGQCQGYRYRGDAKQYAEQKDKIIDAFTKGGNYNISLYGAPHVDVFECERFLLPGVTLHLRLYRAPSNCSLEAVGTLDADAIKAADQTPYGVVIEKASLFLNKVVLSDSVKMSIERALSKSPAVYPYIGNLNKSFIIQAGQNCFVKENIFGTEPIRRLTMCMVRNSHFRGTTIASTPFPYGIFGLKKVEIQRGNGVPIAGTPMDTGNGTRLYYNTISALGFNRIGNGNLMQDFEDNHFILVFDLTSMREASKSFTLFPELTGAGITLNLAFDAALTTAIELFLIGERFSQIYIDSRRNISKNSIING